MSFKDKLLDLNRRGLIQAPEESDESFFQRCHEACCRSAVKSPLAKKLFDIEPDWIDMSFDNKGLQFWEAGCTWVEGKQATLQLKKIFEKKSSYLGYGRDEVVAHELVHVVRAGFEEPMFEELLAYQTSSSKLRRFLAPLFRSSHETLFFIIALSALCILNVFAVFQKTLFFGFIALMGGWLCRLIWTQLTFWRTKSKLSKIVGKEKTLAVMLRLTDREIVRFSKMSKDEIRQYAKKMCKIQMRWQQIFGSYFEEKQT